MKKLLALILALVMVMGLATVGSNAAYLEDKYTDAEDVNFEEAVAVMSAVGVLEGADGKFRPSVELKRSEAAKIVAYLVSNNTAAESMVGVGKFRDVPANHWAAGYIEYLDSIDVFVGNGDGTCTPDGDLTAVAFAKMLLVALGYNDKIEGLVGNDWQINTTKLAADAKLFNGMKNLKPGDTLTREQAAQMAFNAIKAPVVEYSNKGGSISVNGAEINIGASDFNYVTSTIAEEQHIFNDTLTNDTVTDTRFIVEYGERQYPDLYLRPVTDPFGRPANKWVYGKQTVGTFINWDLRIESYTTAITGADLFNLLGESKIENTLAADLRYFVNGFEFDYETPEDATKSGHFYAVGGISKGNMIRNNKVPYPFTGNGVLTEVYEKGKQIIIVSIMTYYAQAFGDYNPTTGQLAVDNMSAVSDQIAPTFTAYEARIDSEIVPGIEKYKDNDDLLVRYAWDEGEGKYIAVEVEDCEKQAGQTVTRFNYGVEELPDNTTRFQSGWLITGGNQTDYAKTVRTDLNKYDNTLLDSTYTLYYDDYGYLVRVKQEEVSKKYVFIAGIDTKNSNIGLTYADAFAIFQDGSTDVIRINLSATNTNIRDFKSVVANGYDTSNVTRDSWNGFPRSTWMNPKNVIVYDEFSGSANQHAYNRWFTYSVSGDVYTLSPCANMIMVSAEETTAGANYRSTDISGNLKKGRLLINTKNARLTGEVYTYANDATAYPNTVGYGNDDSVYITVRTAAVDANLNQPYATLDDADTVYKRGISEVTGIYTGIQSVDITGYNPLNNAYGTTNDQRKSLNPFTQTAWAVVDDHNYLISTVVLGKDGGNTGNYVYAMSAARSEWIEGGYYYWNFNGIDANGALTEMTVKTEYKATIDYIRAAMQWGSSNWQGAIFDVTYDKDGYITSATLMNPMLGDWTGPSALAADIYDYQDIVTNGTGNYGKPIAKEKVYNVYTQTEDTWSHKGNTIYDTNPGGTNKEDAGLTVLNGSPMYVVQQKVDKSTGLTSTSISGPFYTVTQALGAIGVENTISGRVESSTSADSRKLTGYVSAVLNSNGTAKWVVIKNIGTILDNINSKDKDQGPVTAPTGLVLSDYATGSGFTVTVTGRGLENASGGNSYWYFVERLQSDTYQVVDSGLLSYNAAAQAQTGVAKGAIVIADGATGANNVAYDLQSGYSYRLRIELHDSQNKVIGTWLSNVKEF